MQVSHSKKQINKRIITGAKILGTGFVLWLIYKQLKSRPIGWSDFNIDGIWTCLSVVIVLGVVNWWLEAEKWRIAVPKEGYSIQKATSIILRGQALNWIMPFTTGDLLSRLVDVQNRYFAIKSTVIIRTMSFVLTLLFGGASLLYYFQLLSSWASISLLFLTLILCLLGLHFFDFLKGLKLIIIITISRYLTFTLQFYLLLNLFVDLSPLVIVLGIGWIFFFKTISPGIMGKVGLREISGLYFFESLIPNQVLIMMPCFLIWVINSIFPSVIGLITIHKSGILKEA